jgi:carboxyl-terminal processing protease
MKRAGAFTAFLTLVIAVSFTAGVFAPELSAQGGYPEGLFNLRPSGSGRELDPAATYSKVLNTVRDRYVGDVPSDTKMTYSAIHGMLKTLDDPYTRFLDRVEYTQLKEENQGEFEGIGAQLAGSPTKDGYVQIVKPLPNGPAARAGIIRGDLITHIDGKSVVGMTVDQAVKLIRGRANTVVRLTIKRLSENKSREFAITRAPVEFEVVDYSMKAGDIGYVSLAQFNEMADDKMKLAIQDLDRKGMKGLILDLRGNPGGLLEESIDIVSRFVPGNKGAVIIVESGGERDTRKTDGSKYLGGRWPLVVLVNRTSASASEIVSGAIKDNKAGVILGTTTFGKGLVQTVVPLDGGSACMITTAKYLTPSGKDINRSRDQRGGVEPDVMVDVTEEEWIKHKDPQLQKAIELLHQQVAGKNAGNRAQAR